jgi:hypothetical protein
MAGEVVTDETLQRAVAFLSSADGCRILEMRFFFHDADRGEECEVANEEVKRASYEGFMVNPFSGVPVYEYKKSLHPFFVVRDTFDSMGKF